MRELGRRRTARRCSSDDGAPRPDGGDRRRPAGDAAEQGRAEPAQLLVARRARSSSAAAGARAASARVERAEADARARSSPRSSAVTSTRARGNMLSLFEDPFAVEPDLARAWPAPRSAVSRHRRRRSAGANGQRYHQSWASKSRRRRSPDRRAAAAPRHRPRHGGGDASRAPLPSSSGGVRDPVRRGRRPAPSRRAGRRDRRAGCSSSQPSRLQPVTAMPCPTAGHRVERRRGRAACRAPPRGRAGTERLGALGDVLEGAAPSSSHARFALRSRASAGTSPPARSTRRTGAAWRTSTRGRYPGRRRQPARGRARSAP